MAFCSNCGNQVAPGALACPRCGHPLAQPRRKTSRTLVALSLLLGGLLLLVVVAFVAGSGQQSDRARDGDSPQTASSRLFAGRPDAQPEDQERNIAESAGIDGLEGTVKTAEFRQSLSDFEDDGYLVVELSYVNHSGRTKPYNVFDWKLQRPNGAVENTWQSGSAFTQDQLGSGDLVSGGSVHSKLVFKIGGQKGDFYIIWKPDAFDAARGVWKVTV